MTFVHDCERDMGRLLRFYGFLSASMNERSGSILCTAHGEGILLLPSSLSLFFLLPFGHPQSGDPLERHFNFLFLLVEMIVWWSQKSERAHLFRPFPRTKIHTFTLFNFRHSVCGFCGWSANTEAVIFISYILDDHGLGYRGGKGFDGT